MGSKGETMLRHEEERRTARRIAVSCKLDYVEQGTELINNGTLSNLSTNGLAFETNQSIDVGAMVDVRLNPGNTLIPPLDATVEVLRVNNGNDLRSYNVAGRITQINQ